MGISGTSKRERLKPVEAFDHMIREGLYKYHCDPWYSEPGRSHYEEVAGIDGQVRYKGELFVVTQHEGHRGMGGMDEGSPESATIYRIRP